MNWFSPSARRREWMDARSTTASGSSSKDRTSTPTKDRAGSRSRRAISSACSISTRSRSPTGLRPTERRDETLERILHRVERVALKVLSAGAHRSAHSGQCDPPGNSSFPLMAYLSSLPLPQVRFDRGFLADRARLVRETVIPYQWDALNDRIP